MKGKIGKVFKVVGIAAALALGATAAFAAPHGGGGHFGGGHMGGGAHFSGGRMGGGAHFAGSHFAGGRYYAPRAGARVGRYGYGYGGLRGGIGYRAWGGGYWGGAYWPAAYYGWSYPFFLAALPGLYATYWWDSVPYYYVDNVYYTWNPADNGYVATDPPPVAGADDLGAVEAAGEGEPPADAVEAAPDQAPQDQAAPMQQGATAPGDIIAYPRNGQSEQQQATDKYQCHTWARGQSGFDPTDSASASEPMANRAAYQRAMAACLDARGYSTR